MCVLRVTSDEVCPRIYEGKICMYVTREFILPKKEKYILNLYVWILTIVNLLNYLLYIFPGLFLNWKEGKPFMLVHVKSPIGQKVTMEMHLFIFSSNYSASHGERAFLFSIEMFSLLRKALWIMANFNYVEFLLIYVL